jgi:hypothetical protein
MRASKHAPDSEPGKRVTGAGAHTASVTKKRFAVTHPRWEPYARIGLLGVLDARDPGDRRYDQAGAIERPRPDCVAEHVRLELRNVAANYPFERSQIFPGIQPNPSYRDYSRLSCAVAAAGSSLDR